MRELAKRQTVNYIYNMEAQELARDAGWFVPELDLDISKASSGYCSTCWFQETLPIYKCIS